MYEEYGSFELLLFLFLKFFVNKKHKEQGGMGKMGDGVGVETNERTWERRR